MGVEESDQVAMRARETEDNFPVSSGNGHGHAISNDNHSKSSNAGENGGRSEAAEDLDGGAALRVASLDELTQFARNASEAELIDPLFGVVAEIATRGVVRYEWPLLRPLLTKLASLKIEQHFAQLKEQQEQLEVGPSPQSDDDAGSSLKRSVVSMLSSFDGGYPFTIRRICELVIFPIDLYYNKVEEWVWALEKCLRVTSTVSPSPPQASPELPCLADLEREVLDRVEKERKVPVSPGQQQQQQQQLQQNHFQRSNNQSGGGVGIVAGDAMVPLESYPGTSAEVAREEPPMPSPAMHQDDAAVLAHPRVPSMPHMPMDEGEHLGGGGGLDQSHLQDQVQLEKSVMSPQKRHKMSEGRGDVQRTTKSEPGMDPT